MPSIPFALQWSVEKNELLKLKNPIGCLFSDMVSNIPYIEYYLKIQPNNGYTTEQRQIWIVLFVNFEDGKKVDVNYSVTIESANTVIEEECVYKKYIGWGHKICNTDQFFDPQNKYIVDGKFTVKINGILKFDDVVLATIDSQQQKWQGGNLGDESWENDGAKDFTIVVDGDKEIKVHKLILGIRSEFFRGMFNSNMKEAIENKVVITDFSFNVVEAGIKLIYDCNFSTSLSLDELISLLQFFDKYQLPTLKIKVETHLSDQISYSNVCRLTNASVLTNSFKLKEKCMKFLMDSFASKIPIDDMKSLDKDVLLEIVESSFYRIIDTRKI